jgi:hypothetical protein
MASDDNERIAHYEARIQELRARADTVKDAMARELLLHSARDYEILAAMAKKRLGKGKQ